MTKQRNKSDCGIAAVANATGSSYDAVKHRFGRLERGGMEYHEIAWLLSEFGEWKETRPRKQPSLDEWLKRHKAGRYVVIVGRLFDSHHLVAVVDGRITDETRGDARVAIYFRKMEP